MIVPVDVAVVGAGIAGCSAALAAAREGASVMLIDEWPHPGGRLKWSVAVEPRLPYSYAGLTGIEMAARLEADLRAAGVDLRPSTAVWGIFDGNVLAAFSADESFSVRARNVILATGATDMVIPFPGWELPGVMLAAAVSRALHEFRVCPGDRAVVIGDGPEAENVANDLSACGMPVVARAGRAASVRATGHNHLERVLIDGKAFDADLAVLAYGRQPDAELAHQAGCEMVYSTHDDAFVPSRDDVLRTTCERLWVVGDCGGIRATAEAWAEGEVAALAATPSLSEATTALGQLRQTHPEEPARSEGSVDDEVIVCRCEEVRARAIREAISDGARDINDVKRRTRAGMGLCQGIYCTRTIAGMLHRVTGQPLEAIAPMTARPPARPVPISALIAAAEHQE